ncbi:MAG: hypothetical protein CL609_07605 [Anaerolineaceae bacterium]|nr:hypothetical protein [Anaerolineaceae bacterium]
MSDTHPLSIPPELIAHLNKGDCVLFVGDALESSQSISAQLSAALVNACGPYCRHCQATGQYALPNSCEVPLTKAAQLYESNHNRQTLVDFVLGYIDNQTPHTPVHCALAVLPVRVMITTAYDDRLERALQQANRPYLPVVRDPDILFYDPNQVQVIRLQGSVSQPDSLVLTQVDAYDLFARLPTVTKILQGHFASKTLLFIDYGLEDPHFHLLYRQVTGPIARYQRLAYALQWQANPLLTDRWHQKIKLITTEPIPFLTQLTTSLHRYNVQKKQAALPRHPYKFLDYYTEEDKVIFFGRTLEADLLLSTILSYRLAIFYGASGTVKTSLLLARVLPALCEAGYEVAYARMLSEPISEVKAAARRLKRLDQLAPADREQSLLVMLRDSRPLGGRLVIVLDQFEEFFLRQGTEVRRAFVQEMANCLWPEITSSGVTDVSTTRRSDIRFVLSLRDDYLGALDELSPYLPQQQDVFAHRYRLQNLTSEKGLLAILKPAEAFGLPVAEALCVRLMADLDDHGLEPANLQVVLFRLHEDALAQGLWTETSRQGRG